MNQRNVIKLVGVVMSLTIATAAWAGAPLPENREADFDHICKGGPNKNGSCTPATADVDCPKGECVVDFASKPIKGKLTIIMDDFVVDWAQGTGSPKALTLMLEVKAAGQKQILAETYQNLSDPTADLELPLAVVSIPVNEAAVQTIAGALNGLMFVQPESTLATQLRTLFGATGTPVLIAVKKSSELADHTTDGLATVLRFKVKIQFAKP